MCTILSCTVKQAKIILDGKVQGVGLRESIKTQADRLGLVGQVMNLKDGRVGVVCEGAPDSIDKLVSKLQDSPGLSKVNNASVSYLESVGEYESFIVIRVDKNTELVNLTRAGIDHLKVMTQTLKSMDGKLDAMNETNEEGFRSVKEEVQGVKEEVQGVKEEVQGVKEEVQGVKEEVQGVKEEVQGVSGQLGAMEKATQEGFRRVRA